MTGDGPCLDSSSFGRAACSELSLESIEQAWFVVQPRFPIPQAGREMKEFRSVGQGTTERLLNSLQLPYKRRHGDPSAFRGRIPMPPLLFVYTRTRLLFGGPGNTFCQYRSLCLWRWRW